MPRLRWEERNQKWIALSKKMYIDGLREFDPINGPRQINPRLLKRQYLSGRAAIRETQEEVGARTIYAFATRWKKPLSEELTQVWIGRVPEQEPPVYGEAMLKDLIEVLYSRA